MWLIIISAGSFIAGLISFKAKSSKRIWINICTPIVLTLLVVILPGLSAAHTMEFLWRVISIPIGVGCGIIAAFLSEIPIAMLSKRKRRGQTQEMSKR
jgi:hypothetical protein